MTIDESEETIKLGFQKWYSEEDIHSSTRETLTKLGIYDNKILIVSKTRMLEIVAEVLQVGFCVMVRPPHPANKVANFDFLLELDTPQWRFRQR